MCWYKEGLKFKCIGCGKCCDGAPGYVWLTAEEITTIANFLKLEIVAFLKKYTKRSQGKISLLDNKPNYGCTFLKDGKCEIYPVRPKQCRDFPWWEENLQSKEAWEEMGRRCPGINHPDAPLIIPPDIDIVI